MKKLITILAVMMVIVGSAFATSGDKVVLTSSVVKIEPNFKIYYGSTSGTPGTAAGAEVDTGKDISEESISATFVLVQEGSLKGSTAVGYSRFKGTATLTVEIGPFKTRLTGAESDTEQSTDYAITAATKGAGATGKLTIANNGTIANDSHSAEIALTYLGKKLTNSDAGVLCTISATWTADPDLPIEGDSKTYTADVTLTYTVQ